MRDGDAPPLPEPAITSAGHFGENTVDYITQTPLNSYQPQSLPGVGSRFRLRVLTYRQTCAQSL